MKTILKKQLLIAAALILIVVSCKHKPRYVYPQDDKVSNETGIPMRRHLNFFPIFMSSDSSEPKIDTFHLKLFSDALSKLGEPILYNYYTGIKTIRLTWIRQKEYPMVLSLEDNNGKIQLKENGFAPVTKEDKAKNPKDTVKRIYMARTLNYKQEKELLDLLKKNKFYSMPTSLEDQKEQGTELAVEYHGPKEYHVVYRTISDGTDPVKFREICDYIIDLSLFRDEKRY